MLAGHAALARHVVVSRRSSRAARLLAKEGGVTANWAPALSASVTPRGAKVNLTEIVLGVLRVVQVLLKVVRNVYLVV